MKRKYFIILIFVLGILFNYDLNAKDIVGSKKISEIFSDTELAGVIANSYELSELGISNVDDYVSQDELNKIDSLHIDNDNIYSLSGVEYLNNLDSLMIDSKNVTSIEEIKEMSLLNSLIIFNSGITDISAISNMSAIKSLRLDGTLIGNNDLALLVGLESLDWLVLNSEISDISKLPINSKLRVIQLNNTDITDFSPLAKQPKLKWIYAENSKITDLSSFETIENLESLHISNSSVTDISSLKKLTELLWLDISYTDVTDISALEYTSKLSGLIANRSSDVRTNGITDISPLKNLISLKCLELEYQSVYDLTPLKSEYELSPYEWNFKLANQIYFDTKPIGVLDNYAKYKYNHYINTVNKVIQPTSISNSGIFNSENNIIEWHNVSIGDVVNYTVNQEIWYGDHLFNGQLHQKTTFSGTVYIKLEKMPDFNVINTEVEYLINSEITENEFISDIESTLKSTNLAVISGTIHTDFIEKVDFTTLGTYQVVVYATGDNNVDTDEVIVNVKIVKKMTEDEPVKNNQKKKDKKKTDTPRTGTDMNIAFIISLMLGGIILTNLKKKIKN